MKTKIVILIVVFLLSAGVVLFMVAPHADEVQKSKSTTDSARQSEEAAMEPENPKVDPIKERLAAMTLDEKVAQMLIVQNVGITVSADEAERLAKAPYGGYILMAPNYGTLAQTRGLVERLQKLSKTRLIIATDQEGGLVQRVAEIKDKRATPIPEMNRLGRTSDAELAREVGRVMAEEMRTIGINVDFAPDADVFSNPYNTVIGTRSFSAQPDTVSKMSIAVAEGLEDNGVIATYKHFPGHGDTATDSHLSLPIINRTRAELDQNDLIPFKNAVASGAKIIMVGHIALPQIIGDNTPATLSKEMMTGILREECQFEGLIVTDGMNMGAITNNYPEAEASYRAINAGADMLVLPSHPDVAIDAIKKGVSAERIDEAVYRILKFKNDYLEDYEYLDESYFGSAEHAAVVQRIP